MNIKTHTFEFKTGGHTDIHDLTPNVKRILENSGLKEGQATVSAIGSTTGITTIEFEPGLVNRDVKEMLNLLAPYGKSYLHNQTWGDDNGASHLRSLLIGTSYVCPFHEGILLLGTWQQIVFIDFDTRPRNRRVVVQLIGH